MCMITKAVACKGILGCAGVMGILKCQPRDSLEFPGQWLDEEESVVDDLHVGQMASPLSKTADKSGQGNHFVASCRD